MDRNNMLYEKTLAAHPNSELILMMSVELNAKGTFTMHDYNEYPVPVQCLQAMIIDTITVHVWNIDHYDTVEFKGYVNLYTGQVMITAAHFEEYL